MTNNKHTPGPWEFCSDMSGLWQNEEAGGNQIMGVFCEPMLNDWDGDQIANPHQEPNEADAHLIAASPELLKSALIADAFQTMGYTVAAKEWLALNGVPEADYTPVEQLNKWAKEQRRAVIAKAKGE